MCWLRTNSFRVKSNNSIMRGYFCIGFIKKLTKITSMFSPYDFQKNDGIILSYFKDE